MEFCKGNIFLACDCFVLVLTDISILRTETTEQQTHFQCGLKVQLNIDPYSVLKYVGKDQRIRCGTINMAFLLIFPAFYSSNYIFYKWSAFYDSYKALICKTYFTLIQGFHVSSSDVREREKNMYFKNDMRSEITSTTEERNRL